jgi:hypothetical protein
MLEKLKQLNCDRLDLDEAVALHAFAGVMETSFAGFGVASPKWLTDAQRALDEEIRRRARDDLMARLARAKARKEALKTEAQKRADVDGEIAALEAALGGS